jgi:DNA-binding MarR family transcriptional regulator
MNTAPIVATQRVELEGNWTTMPSAPLETVLKLIVVAGSFEQRFNPTLNSVHSLSLQELVLLMHLQRAPMGRLRGVDLANALSLAQSSVTRLAQTLETEGLVRREADTRDARIGYLAVTDAGKQRVKEAEISLETLSQKAFSDRWTDEEIRSMSALLSRLTHAIPGFLV